MHTLDTKMTNLVTFQDQIIPLSIEIVRIIMTLIYDVIQLIYQTINGDQHMFRQNLIFNSRYQKILIFTIFSLYLIGFTTYSFAVTDNISIEGNLNPTMYDTELYKVIASPTNDFREIELSIYGPTGKIASQKATINSGGTWTQFFVKIFPPLYNVDTTYTLEITGSGLIGRKTIKIQDESGSINAIKEKTQIIEPEKIQHTESIRVNDENYDLQYTTLSIDISKIYTNLDKTSLIFDINEISNKNQFQVKLDRELLDSKINNNDDSFFVLIDDEEAIFYETTRNSDYRILDIHIPIGSEKIEIIGSTLGTVESKLEDSSLNIVPKINMEKCGVGTILENGECVIIPNYYAITSCEKLGGTYDKVKLSCTNQKSIQSTNSINHPDQKPSSNFINEYFGIFLLFFIIIIIIIAKSRKKKNSSKVLKGNRIREGNRRQAKLDAEKKRREDMNLFDRLISESWKIEQQNLNFSLLSKNQSNLSKDFKLFESKNLKWEKHFSSTIINSNISTKGLVAIVWEKTPKIKSDAISSVKSETVQSMLSIIDKKGEFKTNEKIVASPYAVVLHETFFACVFPHPRNKLRCYSLIDEKWMNWSERVLKYGKIKLSIIDDVIILSKQKDNSVILKANNAGVFERSQ